MIADRNARAWAVLIARVVLGLMFFMIGVYKVFQMGALNHAERLFVEGYRDTFLPVWSLWAVGTAVPFVEFVAGAMVLIGYRTRLALIALGIDLMTVTFGHLLAEPFSELQVQVIPRLILVVFLLMTPAGTDRYSLDGLLKSRSERS